MAVEQDRDKLVSKLERAVDKDNAAALVSSLVFDAIADMKFRRHFGAPCLKHRHGTGAGWCARVGLVHRVVTADAVDQSPWRAFTRPPGAHIRWTRSRSSLSQLTAAAASSIGFTKQPCQLLAGCHFLDNQRSVRQLTYLSRIRPLKSGDIDLSLGGGIEKAGGTDCPTLRVEYRPSS